MKPTLYFGILLLTFTFSSRVGAQEENTKEAVKEFNEGVKLFKKGEFQAADDAFRRADELNPTWKIKYNIGQCEAALKRYGLAIEAFDLYLEEGGDEVEPARREEVLKELDRLRAMIGFIRVRGEDGVDIYIDEINRGTTPLKKAIMVTAGVEHWIWMVRDGVKLETLNETLSGGDTIELTTPGYVEEPPPPPPIEEPQPEPEPVPQPAPAPVAPTDSGKGLSPALFWIGAGATVLFGGTAGVMAALVNKKWGEIEDKLDAADEDAWDNTDYSTDTERKQVRTMQIIGYVSGGLAGAALITTCVLIPFTNWGGRESEQTATLQVGPLSAPGGGGLLLSGRF